jgi:hypothetical protein
VETGDALQRGEHPVGRRERGKPGGEHVKLDGAGVAPVAGGEREHHGALRGAVAHLVPLRERAADLL